ncbi:cornifelin-like [Carassius gibelio]|uniref:cornifelin-like n=1 Tax=Carassius gibelio TaxID=101364 RepID=UPI0022775E49|nr:cornifelin-like [Carassius gibelio]
MRKIGNTAYESSKRGVLVCLNFLFSCKPQIKRLRRTQGRKPLEPYSHFAGLLILTDMSNPVITQPGAGSYGTNVQTGEWSTGLCSCCSDLLVCGLGFICPIALSCYTANKYGENVCLACVPGGMAAMRTHMRLTYGIQGTICNDALMTCCCGIFETCRMAREIRIRNGET